MNDYHQDQREPKPIKSKPVKGKGQGHSSSLRSNCWTLFG